MSEITIEEAAAEFARWRSQRKGLTSTPESLKVMAASLLASYPLTEICKRLALNSTALRNWAGLKKLNKQSFSSDEFVTLNPISHTHVPQNNEISLKLSTPGGIDCKLTGTLEPSFIAKLLKDIHLGDLS